MKIFGAILVPVYHELPNGPLNAIFRNNTQLRPISYDLLHRNISEETRRMATGRRN